MWRGEFLVACLGGTGIVKRSLVGFGLLLLQKDRQRRMSSMTTTSTLGRVELGSKASYIGRWKVRAADHRFPTERAYGTLILDHVCC
jgi:hypothetical protein